MSHLENLITLTIQVKGPWIPDAGTGLFYSTMFILCIHIAQVKPEPEPEPEPEP